MSWSLSHERQASAVSSIRAPTTEGSVGAGRPMSAAAQRIANPTCSSAVTVNVAVMVESETSTGTPALIAIWFGPPKVRPHEPVLGSRRELEVHLHRALDALDQTQDLVGGIESDGMVALSLGERHRIGHADAAAVRREHRLENERPGPVPALAAKRRGR